MPSLASRCRQRFFAGLAAFAAVLSCGSARVLADVGVDGDMRGDAGSGSAAADGSAQATVLFRIAACGPGDVPPGFDATVIERHCEELRHIYDEYRTTFVKPARAFFAEHRPATVPRTVVYPFGGGDLATVLTTFPDATEITTLSLEASGDVHLVDRLPAEDLRRELSLHRSHVERLYDWGYSRTENLANAAAARLPGEILFALSALAVHGAQPVGLRYFRFGENGAVEYLTERDLAAPDARSTGAFDDVEIRFRFEGDPPGTSRVFRHVGANLDDDHMRAPGGAAILAHLEAKGDVAVMTKAASHLLWDDHFSLVREWLARHVVWMASDSTGLPPHVARAHGLSQTGYGMYAGRPWGMVEGDDGAALLRIFASLPRRALGFHYGYPDKNGHSYLLLTRR